MQSLRIMTPDFEALGELARFSSLQITRRHYGTGEFELHLSDRAPHLQHLAIDRLLVQDDAPHKTMVIESLAYEMGKRQITVRGCTLDGLTKRRLVVPPAEADGSFGWDRITADAETALRHFVANNLAMPPDGKRALPGLVLAENQHRGMVVPWQGRFEQLDALLRDLAEYADLGWTITPDMDSKQLLFAVVPGRDLQAGNGGEAHVIISLAMGNASEIKQTLDAASLKNTAYVGGQGEDELRLILAVGTGNTGLARRECWVDGGSLDMPDELERAGQRKLTQTETKNTLQATVMDRGVFRYERDWDLGDRVTLEGAPGRADARVIEVRETYETGKARQISATFGDAPVTLIGALREIKNTVVR